MNNLFNLMRQGGINNNYGTPDRVQPQNPMNQNAAQAPNPSFNLGQVNQPQQGGAYQPQFGIGQNQAQFGQQNNPWANRTGVPAQWHPGARFDAWKQEHPNYAQREWQPNRWNPPQFGGGDSRYFDGDLGQPDWWNKPNGGW